MTYMKSTREETAAKESLAKKSWQQVRENIGKILPTLLMAFMIGAIGIAVLFYDVTLTIPIVPFLIIPFVFSAMGCIASYPKGGQLSNAQFFRGYPAYYRRPYFGCYRVIWSYFKGLMLGVLIAFFIVFVIVLCLMSRDPDFLADLLYLAALSEYPSLDEFYLYLEENAAMNAFYLSMVGLLFGSVDIMFFYFLLGEAPNPFLLNYAKGLNAKGLTMMKKQINMMGGTYRKDFWKVMWPAYIALPLGYALGFMVGYFIPSNIQYQETLCLACSYAGIFIAVILVLPYISMASSNLAEAHRPEFQKATLDMAKKAFEFAEMQRKYQEQNIKEMKEDIDKMEADAKDGPIEGEAKEVETPTDDTKKPEGE